MIRLFEGVLHVHYGQAYVGSGGEGFDGDMDATFRGQTNGLCGATVAGWLFLITGHHTGHVGFRIELHENEPPVDETYEDVVEVSFRPESPSVELMEWAYEPVQPLALIETDYRVRYSGRGIDAGKDANVVFEGQAPVDSYLLQFWPSLPAPDRILKQTSRKAGHWHAWARTRYLP